MPIKQEIKVFSLFCGMFCHLIFFLKLSMLIFKWKQTLFQAPFLEIKPYSGRIITQNFYETLDLRSRNGKPKLLFDDHSCNFFSPANRRGELCMNFSKQ